MVRRRRGEIRSRRCAPRTAEEYQRLRRQALAWDGAARRMLLRVGLGTGMTCLDVGCGPGEVMRLMGEMVARSC